jgi:hypothetical protein
VARGDCAPASASVLGCCVPMAVVRGFDGVHELYRRDCVQQAYACSSDRKQRAHRQLLQRYEYCGADDCFPHPFPGHPIILVVRIIVLMVMLLLLSPDLQQLRQLVHFSTLLQNHHESLLHIARFL